MATVLDKILRAGEGRQGKVMHQIVAAVNALEPEITALSDDELRGKTATFRQRLQDGTPLDDLQVEAFAVVREAAARVLLQRPYDVQVFGGAVLHGGNIAEMRTGEGKTLTSTMPVYLNALTGRGVHVVTVNEYLAKRDAEWMGKVHQFLGLSVGVVYSGQSKEDKAAAYAADITYGTNNEFGFDYLRDNMALEASRMVQRGHYMALVDEVDSILIDEARTPLIISGMGTQSAKLYQVFAKRVAPNLTRGVEGERPGDATGDYVVDEAKRTIAITEEGVAKTERLLGIDNMYESVNTPLIHHLQNALKAKELYLRDREYIIVEKEVQIVDENTGRVLSGRRYSEGLHQAIEAKEGVPVKEENQTLATITLQNYYRTYEKLAGMTGTAKTEEAEFLEIYSLGVVEVPTNRDVIRDDAPDLIFKTEAAKFEAAAEDILQRHERGQPILVGTTSVEKSELLSSLLTKRGVKHEVLNAKNHAREATIVARAGRLSAVTVSTNMAGRGTDIVLGGNAEELARQEAAELGPEATRQEREEAFRTAFARLEEQFKTEAEQVRQAGGLYVIGTERHDSRRIDNQLRGRSGRQGDPGESRFYLSLGDDLMRLFNRDAVEKIMTRLKIPEDVPIEHKWVSKAVANAQGQVESLNFERRKNVLKYDDVLNEQRKVVYGERQRLVAGDQDIVVELAQSYVVDTMRDLVDEHCALGTFPEDWDLEGLTARVQVLFDSTVDFVGVDLETLEREELVETLTADALRAYAERVEQVGGEEVMRELERRVILSVIDRKWRDHLYEMDALRDGIGLRAVGQRDPLTEYQREAYNSFVAMMGGVKEEATGFFFRVPVEQVVLDDEQGGSPAVAVKAVPLADPSAEAKLFYGSADSASNGETMVDPQGRSVVKRDDGSTVRRVATGETHVVDDKVGRNDPCPCGSGQKFKRCHGA